MVMQGLLQDCRLVRFLKSFRTRVLPIFSAVFVVLLTVASGTFMGCKTASQTSSLTLNESKLTDLCAEVDRHIEASDFPGAVIRIHIETPYSRDNRETSCEWEWTRIS